jgi:hypothetical protein
MFEFLLVPGVGIEPTQPQGPRDFKSLASTSSATQAHESKYGKHWAYIIFARYCQGLTDSLILRFLYLEDWAVYMINNPNQKGNCLCAKLI